MSKKISLIEVYLDTDLPKTLDGAGLVRINYVDITYDDGSQDNMVQNGIDAGATYLSNEDVIKDVAEIFHVEQSCVDIP